MERSVGKFHVGQLVWHRLFAYRGVIYDVDPVFLLSDEWYQRVAHSAPSKKQPWYRVLVDGNDKETYVAESNLRVTDDIRPIDHPSIEDRFEWFEDGRYWPRGGAN